MINTLVAPTCQRISHVCSTVDLCWIYRHVAKIYTPWLIYRAKNVNDMLWTCQLLNKRWLWWRSLLLQKRSTVSHVVLVCLMNTMHLPWSLCFVETLEKFYNQHPEAVGYYCWTSHLRYNGVYAALTLKALAFLQQQQHRISTLKPSHSNFSWKH